MIGRIFSYLFMLAVIPITIGCGVNELDIGDGDAGDSVVVTASAGSAYIEQDIISNNDGSCQYTLDNAVIPDMVSLQIDITSTPLNPDFENNSPISLLYIDYRYVPLRPDCPNITRESLAISAVINPGETGSISIPIASRDILEYFASRYLSGITESCEYSLYLTLHMKEVFFDKTLVKEVRTNVAFLNIITEEECSPTTTNNP